MTSRLCSCELLHWSLEVDFVDTFAARDLPSSSCHRESPPSSKFSRSTTLAKRRRRRRPATTATTTTTTTTTADDTCRPSSTTLTLTSDSRISRRTCPPANPADPPAEPFYAQSTHSPTHTRAPRLHENPFRTFNRFEPTLRSPCTLANSASIFHGQRALRVRLVPRSPQVAAASGAGPNR
jgi:hypothetical protein